MYKEDNNMPYTPNNPYIPGDPYSYDLKWIVSELKKVQSSIEGLDDKIAAAVIAALDQHDPIYYPTAQDLIDSSQKASSIAYIEGFYTAGDGGANLYYVTDDFNDVLAADFYITLAGANKWAIPILTTPFVTPEMFGAHGDGITPDTAAFTAALKTGRELILQNKTYLTGGLELTQPVKITGHDSRLLQAVESSVFLTIDTDDVTVSGIIFDPNASAQSSTNMIVYADGCSDLVFSDCDFKPQYFTSYSATGAVHFKNCTEVQMIRCTLTGANAEGLVFDSGCSHCLVSGGAYYDNTDGSGIWLFDGSSDITIEAITAHGNAGSQIGMAGNGHKLINSQIYDGGSIGVNLGHSPSSLALNCIVSGCIIKDNDTRQVQIQLAGSVNNIIENNVIIGRSSGIPASTVFGIAGANAPVSQIVKGNDISGCYYAITAGSTWIVDANDIHDTVAAAVFLGGATSRIRITNNKARNTISLTGGTVNIDEAVISGNICTGNSSGMYLTNLTNSIVSGNVCSENNNLGISISAGSNNTVTANVCNKNGQRGIYVVSADTLIGNIAIDNTVIDYTIPNVLAKIGNIDSNGLVV